MPSSRQSAGTAGRDRLLADSCARHWRTTCVVEGMGVHRLDDLIAHQFAEEFKLEAYGLISASPGARQDFGFKRQLQKAASGVGAAVAEGFGRGKPKECALFLRYAIASLSEARTHLQDGVDRGYFLESDCQLAFTWAGRCRVVLVKFLASQRRLIAADEARARAARPPRKRRRRTS